MMTSQAQNRESGAQRRAPLGLRGTIAESRGTIAESRGAVAESRGTRDRLPTAAAGRRGSLAALLLPLAVLLTAPSAGVAAQTSTVRIPSQGMPDLEKGDVSVALDRTAYLAGQEAELSVRLAIEDGWHTNSHEPTYDNLIATDVGVELPPGWGETDAPRYPAGVMRQFSFADDAISVYEGEVFVRASMTTPEDATNGTYPIRANVTYQACDDRMCLAPVTTQAAVGLVVAAGGEAANPEFFASAGDAGGGPATTQPGAVASGNLLWFILLGLIGGLILNAMPCVLPVLSLKVFGLVKSAEAGRRTMTTGSLAMAAGIILSFLLLAAAAVAARSAGVAVGWGIQFQEPLFVGALAVVVLLFTLNMWGLFEIRLPRALARVGSSGPSEGLAGHLATGFFATLMATPCSAPFLGTALGFALTQNTATTVTMFAAIGTGMASPYLLLAAFPGMGRVLPRPGPWMATFRVVMGFFLAATLVWLLFVLSGLVAAPRVAFFEGGLLAVALAMWLAHRAGGGRGMRRLAGLSAAALGVLAVAFVAQGRSDAAPSALGVAPEDRLIAWEPFDRSRAEELAAEGRFVFVDVTADWCFTCKVNEALFLETEEVAGAFEHHGVVAMRADWTRRDESISAYLADFGRYGIPFYVLYRPERDPFVFSELISKSAILQLLE